MNVQLFSRTPGKSEYQLEGTPESMLQVLQGPLRLHQPYDLLLMPSQDIMVHVGQEKYFCVSLLQKRTHFLEFVLTARRFDERGVPVVVTAHSRSDVVSGLEYLLSLPDEHYATLAFRDPLDIREMNRLLTLNPRRRQVLSFSESRVPQSVALAILESPMHMILHSSLFADGGIAFIQHLSMRQTCFGSLTLHSKQCLSPTAWVLLLDILNQPGRDFFLIEHLELLEVEVMRSDLLFGVRTKSLLLKDCILDDEGVELSRAIGSGTCPPHLILDNVLSAYPTDILSFQRWSIILNALTADSCRLQHLHLGSSSRYDVGGYFPFLVEALSGNHSLASLTIQKYDGIRSFWDDLVPVVVRHPTLKEIHLVYESNICNDAVRMCRAMARMLQQNRSIRVTFDGEHHNRAFNRLVEPWLRFNRFFHGVGDLRHVQDYTMRSHLLGKCLRNSHKDRVRTGLILSQHYDVLLGMITGPVTSPLTPKP